MYPTGIHIYRYLDRIKIYLEFAIKIIYKFHFTFVECKVAYFSILQDRFQGKVEEIRVESNRLNDIKVKINLLWGNHKYDIKILIDL